MSPYNRVPECLLSIYLEMGLVVPELHIQLGGYCKIALQSGFKVILPAATPEFPFSTHSLTMVSNFCISVLWTYRKKSSCAVDYLFMFTKTLDFLFCKLSVYVFCTFLNDFLLGIGYWYLF